MNQQAFKRFRFISAMLANVSCKRESVKSLGCKFVHYLKQLFIFGAISFGSGAALAQDITARAIMNSNQLLGFVDGVVPEALPTVINAINTGEIKRLEPTFPVWILSSASGEVLYYQGQTGFVGQSGSRLVDDAGFRFGLRALDMARNSKSTWVKLQLGGREYRAYCAARAPFVVCSLIQ